MAKKSQRKRHPLLRWCRSIGLVSIVFGGCGLITPPDYFWASIILVNLGLGLLGLDVVFSSEFADWPITRSLLLMVFGAAFLVFNHYVVFVDAPLRIMEFSGDGSYPTGTTIGGISWSPKYREFRVNFFNDTNYDYSDLDIVARPDQSVAAIGQITNLAGVRFEDPQGVGQTMEDEKLATGIVTSVQFVPLASEAGYRVRADKLPAHGQLDLVMAAVVVNAPKAPCSSIFYVNCIETVLARDGANHSFNHWFANRVMDDLYGDPPIIKSVWISAEYIAAQRKRTHSQNYPVTNIIGNLPVKLQGPGVSR